MNDIQSIRVIQEQLGELTKQLATLTSIVESKNKVPRCKEKQNKEKQVQYDIKSVTSIQACIRGYLTRKEISDGNEWMSNSEYQEQEYQEDDNVEQHYDTDKLKYWNEDFGVLDNGLEIHQENCTGYISGHDFFIGRLISYTLDSDGLIHTWYLEDEGKVYIGNGIVTYYSREFCYAYIPGWNSSCYFTKELYPEGLEHGSNVKMNVSLQPLYGNDCHFKANNVQLFQFPTLGSGVIPYWDERFGGFANAKITMNNGEIKTFRFQTNMCDPKSKSLIKKNARVEITKVLPVKNESSTKQILPLCKYRVIE